MPAPAYLKIKGPTGSLHSQGATTADSIGNIYQEGHEDEIMVQAFSHRVTRPISPQSGQPTGQRVHEPLIVTKIFDKSSPLLNQALCEGQVLPECVLSFYRIATNGTQELYYTITLQDAVIVAIQSSMAHCEDKTQAHLTQVENVHFSYRKIIWKHEIASTEASDDWRALSGPAA